MDLRIHMGLCMDVRVGLEKKLSAELILLNWGVGEDS